jgi:hypothetical protein
MTVSLVVVLAVTAVCCGLVWLLPRAARVERGETEDPMADTPAVETGGSSSR